MKINKILSLIILVLFITFVGCDVVGLPSNVDDDNSANRLVYTIDDSKCADEIQIKDFDLSMIKINASRNNSLLTSFDVNEDMLSDEDLGKLSEVGTHVITIKYKDVIKQVTINLIENKIVSDDNPGGDIPDPISPTSNVVTYVDSAGYYQDAVGLNGNELKLALRKITTKGYVNIQYSELNNFLGTTDASPTNPNKMLLFYLRTEISPTWDGGKTWNKEHVWPRSQGWFQYTEAGCDAHHIRPVDSGENSRRGNKPYGVGSGFYTPKDEVKGDCARIIFYLLTRYSESDSYKITNVAQSMKMLLDWNKLDPVDNFERNRNEEIYKRQKNRNPFIDYSDYAYYIWDTSYLNIDFNESIEVVVEKIIYFCDIENKKRAIYL